MSRLLTLSNTTFLTTMLLLVFSCAKPDKRERGLSDPLRGGSVTAIDEQSNKEKTLPKVMGGGQKTNLYGPYPEDLAETWDKKPSTQNAVVALQLGAGMARALLHTNIIKAIKHHDVPAHIIMGTELGAVFAAMFAYELTPDIIEWRVFNFINETQKLEFFSSEWLEKVENVLLKDIIDKNIEQAAKALIIPVFDIKKAEVVYISRGDLRSAIRAQFDFKAGFFKKYSSPLMADSHDVEFLKSRGADFTIGVSSISKRLSFRKANGYLAGLMGRVISFSGKRSQDFDAFIELPTGEIKLDSTVGVDRIIEKTLPSISEKISLVKESLADWSHEQTQKKSDKSQANEFDQNFFIREND